LELITVEVGKVTAYDRNPRTHSDAQVGQIAASIQQFGFTNPLLVDERLRLIAGHGRLAAALKLGLAEVPCLLIAGLSDEQRRALIIADNKLAQNSGWNVELLAAELDSLQAADFDMPLLGFSDGELSQLVWLGEPAGEVNRGATWAGMPEFTQQDKTAFRSIVVHFNDQAAVDKFAGLVEQTITDKTRFLWYPPAEIETYVDKRYAESSES
jgi:ParB/Sulfiredoxin domain